MNVKIMMPDGRTIPMQIRARHYHKLSFLVRRETIFTRVRHWWLRKRFLRQRKNALRAQRKQVLSEREAAKIPMQKVAK